MKLAFRRFGVATAFLAIGMAPGIGFAGERLPVLLVSSSPRFDRACTAYYRQGNDPDVLTEFAKPFCTCLGAEYEHLGTDALDFFARTYSEDLTAFIDEYSEGQYWMDYTGAADKSCKENDYGSNEAPNPPPALIPAGSWGGVVRSGPGGKYSRIGTLEQGEHVMLMENTGVMWNGYPWWKIEIWGGNAIGYQWGGILCSLNAPMEGIYESCS